MSNVTFSLTQLQSLGLIVAVFRQSSVTGLELVYSFENAPYRSYLALSQMINSCFIMHKPLRRYLSELLNPRFTVYHIASTLA